MGCPECRSDIPWERYSELDAVRESMNAPLSETSCADEEARSDQQVPACQQMLIGTGNTGANDDANEKESSDDFLPEAFVRLHHLWQGNDEKEKPLLRLLKEMDLNARVYYGKPALLHIQGSQKDVDAFAGTAKRRHIT